MYLHSAVSVLTRLICPQSGWTYIQKCRQVSLFWWRRGRRRRPKLILGASSRYRCCTGSALTPPVPLCPCPAKGYEQLDRVFKWQGRWWHTVVQLYSCPARCFADDVNEQPISWTFWVLTSRNFWALFTSLTSPSSLFCVNFRGNFWAPMNRLFWKSMTKMSN